MEFIIVCNDKGIVQEIILDTSEQLMIGNSLFPFVDSFSISKILTFYQEVENKGSALNWEINFSIDEILMAFIVSGFKRNNEIQIIGYTINENNQQIINILSEINNSQSALLRSSIKENIKHALSRDLQSDESVIQFLKKENKLLKNQVISSSRLMERQLVDLEQKLISFQETALLMRENLLAVYDEIACSLKLIATDYQQGIFSKQSELKEIEAQLEVFNNVLEKWSAKSIE